jgi:DNA polymerase III subunit delta'
VSESTAPLLPWLREPLHAALAATRDHHLLLVHGPQGVGQFEFALSLAQAWLCEAEAGTVRPCGQCASCRLVQSHNHPDLLVLLPEVLQEPLGWAPAAGEEGAAAKSERKPSKEIKVDAARQAVAFAQLSCARGRAKVVVLYPAERLNAVAANTLLKTLEEPPGLARFVLASGAPEALPATVRSRCQALLLALPSAAQAERWLAEQGIAGAAVLLAASGGQPLTAKAWAEEGIDAATWAELPERVARGDAGGLSAWPVPRAIDALLKLCHDAMLASLGSRPRYFPTVPAAPALAPLQAWQAALIEAARYADHPVNAALLVESLVMQGRRALRQAGPEDAPSLHSRHD